MRTLNTKQPFSCLSAVLVLILLPGCSPPRDTRPVQEDFTIRIERAPGVPPGELYLKPVPGGLRGAARDVELLDSNFADARFDVPVGALTQALEQHAGLARDDHMNPGELANPRDMHIARIAAFFRSPRVTGQCESYRTGLHAAWPQRAMLVYVDRPGVVRGQRYVAPWIMDYDLEFPAAGVYALVSTAQGHTISQRVLGGASQLVARVTRDACNRSGDIRQAAR